MPEAHTRPEVVTVPNILKNHIILKLSTRVLKRVFIPLSIEIKLTPDKDSGKIMEQEAPGICLLPRQKWHWQNLYDVTILELWSLLKACNFRRRLGW